MLNFTRIRLKILVFKEFQINKNKILKQENEDDLINLNTIGE